MARFKEGGLLGIFRHYFSVQFMKNQVSMLTDTFLKFNEKRCFRLGERSGFNRKRIIFHCSTWGEFIDLFFSYGVPSLLQEGNVPTLLENGYAVKLLIYTKSAEDVERIKRHCDTNKSMHGLLNIEIIPVEGAQTASMNTILTDALLMTIQRCLDDDAIFIITPPDTVYGNGSLFNALKLVEGKGVCLAASHPRIDQEAVLSSGVLDRLGEGKTIENDELVDITFQYGHEAITRSFDNEDENATMYGTSIRQVNNRMYSVINNLPTVYLANFTEKDLKFFKKERTFNNWDRGWLRMLFNDCRIKFVGSSELFFCVELTPRSVEITLRRNLLNNDFFKSFNEMRLHNYVCNTCCCSWVAREGKPMGHRNQR